MDKFEIVVDDIITLSGKYKIEVEYIQGNKITLTLYKKSYSFTEFTKQEYLIINFKDNLDYVSNGYQGNNNNGVIVNSIFSYYDENKLYENFPKYISGLIGMGIESYHCGSRWVQSPSKNSMDKIDIITNEFNKFNLKSYRREKRLQKILKNNG